MNEQSDAYSIWLYEEISEIKKDKLYLVKHRQSGELAIKRYIREEVEPIYRLLSQLHSQNLPRLYGMFETDGRYIVIEEYVQGATLQALSENGEKFSHKQVKDYGLQLCNSLHAIHSKGIIHRDIKLSNVILTAEGTIKLIDFDAARLYDQDADKDTEYIGTHGYAAPEQYGFAQSDARSDIYAVGVLLNKLWGNRGGRINRVIKRCTNLDPNRRYRSAKQLTVALKINDVIVPAIIAAAVLVIAMVIVVSIQTGAIQETANQEVSPSPSISSSLSEQSSSLPSQIISSGSEDDSLNDLYLGDWTFSEDGANADIVFTEDENKQLFISIDIEICTDFEENVWRSASIANVPCTLEKDGYTVTFTYEDDGWGNSGTGQIHYTYEEDWRCIDLSFIEVEKSGAFGIHEADGWSILR